MSAEAASVSVVVVSYNAREHLERCLSSVADAPYEVIVVDNASSDGSRELVRERFASARLVELEENVGFGAANNEGMAVAGGRYFLLLNSDAWPVGDGIERLVGVAEREPRAGAVGPRLLNPDGSLQRSVRGFPTVWRLATEYLFLRKLAPSSAFANAFYGAGFDHSTERDAEFLMGAVLLLRREAVEEVGGFDPSFFLFSEETDLCYRLHRAGWRVVFTPEAEFVHVGGASTRPVWGRMYREQLRSHLRFLAKHRSLEDAERARLVLLAGAQLRSVVFRGERRAPYREAARWLASADAATLLESPA